MLINLISCGNHPWWTFDEKQEDLQRPRVASIWLAFLCGMGGYRPVGYTWLVNFPRMWNPLTFSKFVMEPQNGGLENDLFLQLDDFRVPC